MSCCNCENEMSISFNTKFRYLPDLPTVGNNVIVSGCGIDIKGVIKRVEIDGDVYNAIIEKIYEFE